MLLILVGCDSEPPPARTVVIYAPSQIAEDVDNHLTRHGFDVVMVAGESSDLTSRIIDKADSPRADVIVVDRVADAWRAGDRGALRPLRPAVQGMAQDKLRDPDGTWVTLTVQPALILLQPGRSTPAPVGYADLGAPDYAGRLCLVSSTHPLSRAVVGMLIEQLGAKPAERIVRRWVRNLAQPPFATMDELAAAFGAGDCGVALVTSGTWIPSAETVVPDPLFYNVRAAGVSRHAEYPDTAQDAVARLLEMETGVDSELLDKLAMNVSVAGWRDEEARLLAERAGYR
jgi:iron(III) transport system substrate-binding protein